MRKKSLVVFIFFFFSSRRRHTRYWRDWSSDVCSSDLRGEDHVGGDPLAAAVECPELAGQHVHGADQQDRMPGEAIDPDPVEVHPSPEQRAEVFEPGDRDVVGTDGGQETDALQRGGPQHPRIDRLLDRTRCGVVGPEPVQSRLAVSSLAVEQSRPCQRRAHRSAGGPAEAHQLVLVELVGGQQSAEHTRREDRKSTRLNSSHANISYAVFCLKKKKLKSDVTSPETRPLAKCTASSTRQT